MGIPSIRAVVTLSSDVTVARLLKDSRFYRFRFYGRKWVMTPYDGEVFYSMA